MTTKRKAARGRLRSGLVWATCVIVPLTATGARAGDAARRAS